jgi:Zn-dependent protease
MLGWSINLFKIRGIQLSLHFSFPLLLAHWAWDGYKAAGPAGAAWSTALIVAIFTCVVLHELGHSLTARRFGVGVRRILLMPIGGMAEFDSIPRQPRSELLITAAGPAVNYVLAALLFVLLDSASGLPDNAIPASVSEFVWCLFYWNLTMGIFNLAPVFPMDGGRILRAFLALRLPYVRATHWAVLVGKVLSATGAIAAFWTDRYLLGALTLFIYFAGDAEYRALLRREREDAQWRAIMAQLQTPSPTPEPPILDP